MAKRSNGYQIALVNRTYVGFWEHHDHFSFARGGCEFDSIGLAYTDNRTEIVPTYPAGATVARNDFEITLSFPVSFSTRAARGLRAGLQQTIAWPPCGH